jgi:hypothetical protein
MITRKESMPKLTDIHCENLKQEKLDAYKKDLESKQIEKKANGMSSANHRFLLKKLKLSKNNSKS